MPAPCSRSFLVQADDSVISFGKKHCLLLRLRLYQAPILGIIHVNWPQSHQILNISTVVMIP